MNTDSLPGLDVSRETIDVLAHYKGLLEKWNPVINLVSKNTIPEVWNRHIVDSAQIYKFSSNSMQKWVDIGSGGGFPGLVCALLAKGDDKAIQFTLVESDARKCAFLRTVAAELQLDVIVKTERIEKLSAEKADVLSARALAPLDKLLEFSSLHLNKDGHALLLKGSNFREELEIALKKWNFSHEIFPSVTSPDSVIIKIGDLKSA